MTNPLSPPPPFSLSPSPQQHVPLPPFTPQDRTNVESPEETGQGERGTPGEVMGRADRARKGKDKGKDKRERIIVVLRSPCQDNDPAAAHTGAQVGLSLLDDCKVPSTFLQTLWPMGFLVAT